jgi:hypothetical protein
VVVVHATTQIPWQAAAIAKMSAGLKALGVAYQVTDSRARTDDGLAILFGTTFWRDVERTGDYLLVDRCSFNDTNKFVSLVRNGHGRRGDHRVPHNAPGYRWQKYGVEVAPWHSGSRVVLCGQTESYSPTSLVEFYKAKATHFRKHPAGDNPTGLPETRSWENVGSAITLNSSVGVDAVLAGVPTVTLDEGAMAWEVTGHSVNEIVKPPRQDWLNWLAWTQWSWDEIAEGKPWQHLL